MDEPSLTFMNEKKNQKKEIQSKKISHDDNQSFKL